MKFLLLWLLLTQLPDLPPPAADPFVAEPQPARVLTLEEALQRARELSPEVRQAVSEVRAAWYDYQKEGTLPNAQLSAGTFNGQGQAVLNSSYSGLSRDFYLQLSQNFGPLGSVATAGEIARNQYLSAYEQWHATQVKAVRDAKDGFYQLLAAQESNRVAERTLAWADEIYSIAKVRHEAGASPRLELINAGAERNQAVRKAVKAKALVDQVRARLNPLLGLRPQDGLELAGSLEAPPLTLRFEDLLEAARAHPRARAAEAELDKARSELKLATQLYNPSAGLFAVYDITNPGYVVGAQISVPLDWGQIRNEVHSKEEKVGAVQAALDGERVAVVTDLRAAWSEYQAAFRNADTYLADILTPLEEAARITKFGYTNGAMSYMQMLQAQTRLEEARLEYIDSLLSVHLAYDAIEAAAGYLKGARRDGPCGRPIGLPPQSHQKP